MRKCQILSMLFLLFAVCDVFAGRPLSTDGTAILDIGAFEIETAYETTSESDDSNSRNMYVCLKHGLTEKMHIGIEIPYDIKPGDGLDSSSVSMKFGILKENSVYPGLALCFSTSPGSSAYNLKTLLSKTFGKYCSALNLKYAATGDVEKKGSFCYSLGLNRGFYKSLIFSTEFAGKSIASASDEAEALCGFSLELFDLLLVDAGYGWGLNKSSIKDKFTTGIACEF